MSKEVNVILDFSPEVQTILDEQDVNLYEELQRELPSIRLIGHSDFEAPQRGRHTATVIAVNATLVSTLTPIIVRILNILTPPDRAQTWVVEEVETHLSDGNATVHRKRVRSRSEQQNDLHDL